MARAREYAERKGWTVAEKHIYVDDGISGAEFVRREGYLRLMNALKPRSPFQILVMMEQSRLGREQTETAYAPKRLSDAGVRIAMDKLAKAVLDTIDRTLLSPERLEAIAARVAAAERAGESTDAGRTRLERQWREARAKVGRSVRAIGEGLDLAEIREQLTATKNTVSMLEV